MKTQKLHSKNQPSKLTIADLNQEISNSSIVATIISFFRLILNPILFTLVFLGIYFAPSLLPNTQAQSQQPSQLIEKSSLAGALQNESHIQDQVTGGINITIDPNQFKKPIAKPIAVRNFVTQSLPTSDHTNTNGSFSIKGIGLSDILVGYDSINNIDRVNNNLRYSPIIENQMAYDFCTQGKNTYLMGHSEPGSAADIGHSASYVFDRLHTIRAGERIQATNAQGISCTYEVETIWELYTDSQGAVTSADFSNLMYPATNGDGILTIQTCIKGTSTGRLFVRARMI